MSKSQARRHHCTKKWSFPLRISSVNVTKSAVSCGFGHIYWRNMENFIFLCSASQFHRVLQICSNECWIRARWIIDKNNNVYKTKMTETIHMLILQHQILKAQKSFNHDEYCYHIKQFTMTSANSYCSIHILFIYYVLYFPLWTSTLYFQYVPFFFIDRAWKHVLSI